MSTQNEFGPWTENDFEAMGWHEVAVHALGFEAHKRTPGSNEPWGPLELRLDIDYILRWIHPQQPGERFNFETAPATLTFSHVFNVAGPPGCGSPSKSAVAFRSTRPLDT